MVVQSHGSECNLYIQVLKYKISKLFHRKKNKTIWTKRKKNKITNKIIVHGFGKHTINVINIIFCSVACFRQFDEENNKHLN